MKKTILLNSLLLFASVSMQSCDMMLPTTYPNDPYQGTINTNPNHGGGDYNAGYMRENFSGRYTNEGDSNRAGNFTMSISQSGNHISGTARYSSANGDDSGLLSVDGHVNDDVADLQIFDQRGNMVADAVLSHNEGDYSFIQNSSSSFVPQEALLYRAR